MIPRLHSLAQLKPNPEWAKLPLFDRKGWRTMAFGEFAESVNDRVEPSTAAEEIYVGLDDLDSGSLHIRRWGKGSDVIGTKLRFRKSDIIFGRRRAYQRFRDEAGFTRVAMLEEIRAKDGNLSIPLYVAPAVSDEGLAASSASETTSLPSTLAGWLESSKAVRQHLNSLLSAK